MSSRTIYTFGVQKYIQVILALGNQKLENSFKFKARIVYTVNSELSRAAKQNLFLIYTLYIYIHTYYTHKHILIGF